MTTPHSTSLLKGSQWLGILRGLQLLFSIIILGVTSSNISTWHSNECNTPTRLSLNVAVAAIALPFLIYLLATSWPLQRRMQFLPWSRWLVLGIDVLLFVLWVAAAALSDYTCEGLCEACTPFGNNYGPDYYVYAGSLTCSCEIPSVDDDSGDSFTRLLRRAGLPSSSSSRISSGIGKANKLNEKVGLDWTMFVLTLIALALTVFYIYKDRRNARAAPTGPTTAQQTVPEQDTKEPQVETAHAVPDDNIPHAAPNDNIPLH